MNNNHRLIGTIFIFPNSRCATTIVGYNAEPDHYQLRMDGQREDCWISREEFEEAFAAGAITLAFPVWAPFTRPPGSKLGGLALPSRVASWPASC